MKAALQGNGLETKRKAQYIPGVKKTQNSVPDSLASQEGFEPPTDGLEGRCSIQLSYWDSVGVMRNTHYIMMADVVKGSMD